jgi:hypothetical protein
MIIFIENPNFSKMAGQKINIQKSAAFPYTNHEVFEKFKKAISYPM